MSESPGPDRGPRFEVPAGLPGEPIDGYQARLRRAQQFYRTSWDAAWDGEAIHQPVESVPEPRRGGPEEATDRPADEEPWQPPAVVGPGRQPRWPRRRGRGRSPEPHQSLPAQQPGPDRGNPPVAGSRATAGGEGGSGRATGDAAGGRPSGGPGLPGARRASPE